MIGSLPTSLSVGGKEYAIRSDYRDVMRIFEAMSDEELDDKEKFYVMLRVLYVDFDSIPPKDYKEAYEQASRFMESHDRSDDKKNPQLINWQKDEHMIFPAINAVAGCEVRAVEYMHWWTFLGYFENIDNECLWSFVLSIRQKRAKGKKLEKHEREFFYQNRDLCSVAWAKKQRTEKDVANDIFEMLLEEGGSKNG